MRFSARLAALLPIPAALLFRPLLRRGRVGPRVFGGGMGPPGAVLVTFSLLADRSRRLSLLQDWREGRAKKIGLAVLSSLVLYGIFWAGNVLTSIAFPSAGKEIAAVYSFKQDASVVRIGLLIVFIIGPGEELFWRGFVQRRWQRSLVRPSGWLLASLFYAAVHVGSGNFMLVLSALVCGLYWGAIYARFQSVTMVAISHTIWDMLIFVFFPLA